MFSSTIPRGPLVEACVKAAGGISGENEDEDEADVNQNGEDTFNETQYLNANIVPTLYRAATYLHHDLLTLPTPGGTLCPLT